MLSSAQVAPEALVNCADASHTVTLPASAPLASCFGSSAEPRHLVFEVRPLPRARSR